MKIKIGKLTKKYSLSLSLSLSLLVVSILTGFVAGQIIRSNSSNTEAASANIIVTDNNQVTTQDQSTSTQTITRTSTVTIKDSSATAGYTLSARLSQNTIPNSTVTIGSGSSSICALASPCTLTTTTRDILTTDNSNATGAAGDTTTWTVTIIIPANTALGNYILDIEYGETSPQPLANGDSMQSATPERCAATPSGTTVNLTDHRDSKVYRIKKMADNRCWMIDNLAYDIGTASGRPLYSPSPIINPVTSTNTQAQYALNPTYTTSAGQTTYLYNWCAALGDISNNCSASLGTAEYGTAIAGTTVSGTATSQPDNVGICPAPFRLPKSSVENGGGINEFLALKSAISSASHSYDTSSIYASFMGTQPYNNYHWHGVLSGSYYAPDFNGLHEQDTAGNWWSSTAITSGRAYGLHMSSHPIIDEFGMEIDRSYSIATATYGNTKAGFAIRCIL